MNKKEDIIEGVNCLLEAKINIAILQLSYLVSQKQGLITCDVDPFRVGRLVEKIDQCIHNINSIQEELDFLNPNIEEEEESIFEHEGGADRFYDKYPDGILTGIEKGDFPF